MARESAPAQNAANDNARLIMRNHGQALEYVFSRAEFAYRPAEQLVAAC
jgi:hypothetical protein